MLAVRFVAMMRIDLSVAKLLRGAEHTVAGIADHDVDPTEVRDSAIDDRPQRLGVADVEHLDAEQVGVLLAEVGDRLRVCERCRRRSRRGRAAAR